MHSKQIAGVILVLSLLIQPANALTHKSSQAATHTLDLVGHIGGIVTTYAAQNNYVYATTRSDFVVLDAANPAQVEVAGQVGFTVPVNSLAVNGTVVVANAGANGLRIFDVSNPAQPVLTGSMSVISPVVGIKLTGTLALVSTEADFEIVNLAQPAAPQLVGSFPATGDLEIQGNIVFVANQDRIRIVDVTNPVSPTLVTDYAVDNGEIEVEGHLLYVWLNKELAGGAGPFYYGFLRVLDVSNLSNIREVYVSSDNYGRDETLRPLGNIKLAGGRLFGGWFMGDRHGLAGSGVSSLDVEHLVTPKLMAVGLWARYALNTLGLGPVSVAGSRVYFAHGGILYIFDTATNLELGQYQFWGANKVQVEHHVAHIAATSGLVTVDVAVPEQPAIEDTVVFTGLSTIQALDLAVYGSTVFVGAFPYDYLGDPWLMTAVVDASNRSDLKLVSIGGYLHFPTGNEPVTRTTAPQLIHNGYAYDFQLGPLSIYSLDDPAYFNVVAQIPITVANPHIAIAGNYAYVTGANAGLQIINVTNPRQPVSVKLLNEPLNVLSVVSAGQKLFVVTLRDLKIFSLADPENPVEISSTPLAPYDNYQFVDFKVAGNYVYIILSPYAFRVYDAIEPNGPLNSVISVADGDFSSIDVVGNLVYLTNRADGLFIFRHNIHEAAQPTTFLPFTSNQPYVVPSQCEISYRTYLKGFGWLDWVTDSVESGAIGQAQRVEAFQVKLCKDVPAGLDIALQAHVQDIGWMDWNYDGEIAGVPGQDKQVEAVRFKLLNAPAGYRIDYRVYEQGIGWSPVVSDGQIAGTVGQSKPIEAIQIDLIKP